MIFRDFLTYQSHKMEIKNFKFQIQPISNGLLVSDSINKRTLYVKDFADILEIVPAMLERTQKDADLKEGDAFELEIKISVPVK